MAVKTKTLLFMSLLVLQACSGRLPVEVAVAYDKLPPSIDFNFQVRPILSGRCFKCHGPDGNARQGDLRLDLEERAFSKLRDKEGFPIVPGKPGKSMMIERILNDDP